MVDASNEERRRRVRASGLRCTAARMAVLRQLEAADAPMTHGEVVESLRGAGFDQSTVYRNLIAQLPAGAKISDYVTSLEIRARRA